MTRSQLYVNQFQIRIHITIWWFIITVLTPECEPQLFQFLSEFPPYLKQNGSQELEFALGVDARLSCNFSNSVPGIKSIVTWYKRNSYDEFKPVTIDGTKFRTEDDTFAAGKHLFIDSMEFEDFGSYKCEVASSFGEVLSFRTELHMTCKYWQL